MDKLTAACIAARLAGMSYGKYMAMLHASAPTPEAPKRKKKKQSGGIVGRLVNCPICWTEFSTTSPSHKYCSDDCRRKADRQAYKRWYDKQRIGE